MSNELTFLRKINGNKQIDEYLSTAVANKKDQALGLMATLARNNYALVNCEPMSIAAAVVEALSLDLSPLHGEIYVIPYGNKATTQIGYKGLISLATATGKVKCINHDLVYEGEFLGKDKLTGEYNFNGQKKSDNVVGYFAYLETTDGFRKTIFMTSEEIHKHFVKFSLNNYDEKKKQWMESKKKGIASKILTVEDKGRITVLKQLLGKWAPKNSKLEQAIQADGKVYDENGAGKYDVVSEQQDTTPQRVIADKEDILAVLKQVGEAVKAQNKASTKVEANKFANALAVKSGIDFKVSGGWYGITQNELIGFCIIAEQDLNIEIKVNDVRLSEQKPTEEQEKDIDVK